MAVSSLLALCSGAVALVAPQAPPAPAPAAPVPAPAPLRGPGLVTVTAAADGEVVSGPTPTQHGLVALPDQSLWLPVIRAQLPTASGEGSGSSLELWRSTDRGGSWSRAAVGPLAGAAEVAIAPADGGLWVACTARGDQPWGSIYVQRFDAAKAEFVAAPTLLVRGTGEEDQYFLPDLDTTSDGAVVVAFGTHRRPPGPIWRSGWSTGLCWLRPGATAWQGPLQANHHTSGCAGTLAAFGPTVDLCYRTNPSFAMHGLRGFDPASGAFLQEEDVMAMRQPQRLEEVANTAALAFDGTGGRTLLHVLGGDAPGAGTLAISYAPPGDRAGPQFTTRVIDADPPLVGGNQNPQHFALARGPGNQLFAYYSKAAEQHADLWQLVLEEGQPVGTPRRVARGEPGTFLVLSGNRARASISTAHVVATSRTQSAPGGTVAVYGTWPARSVAPTR